jgi:anti-sigma B factor antagonist
MKNTTTTIHFQIDLARGSKATTDLDIAQLGVGSDAHVALVGDLDEAGGKLARQQLAQAVKSGKVNLTIDLDSVGALESGGLAALIATLRLARDRGGNVQVQASQPHIRRVMELTGLSRVFRLTTADLTVSAAAA